MSELRKLGYARGKVTRNTFVYKDKAGKLRGMEKGDVDSLPSDYGGDGFYPSAIWIASAGKPMSTAYNQGLIDA